MRMSRQRTLSPTIWEDEELNELASTIRLLALFLHFVADDEGRGYSKPSRLKADLWLDDESVSEQDVEAFLWQLADIGYLDLFEVDGRGYFALRELSTIQRASPSKLPAPPERSGTFRNDPSRLMAEGGGSRGTEGEPGGDGDREPGPGPDLSDLPSAFCVIHQPRGSGRGVDCRDCGDARQYHQQVARDRRRAARRASAEEPV